MTAAAQPLPCITIRATANQWPVTRTPASGSVAVRIDASPQAILGESMDTQQHYGSWGAGIHGGSRLARAFATQRHYAGRSEGLRRYLEDLMAESAVEKSLNPRAVEHAWLAWKRIERHLNPLEIEIPDACPGQTNSVLLTWNRGPHYLECEVFADTLIEWFYRNKETGEFWSEDASVEAPLPAHLATQLLVFVL